MTAMPDAETLEERVERLLMEREQAPTVTMRTAALLAIVDDAPTLLRELLDALREARRGRRAMAEVVEAARAQLATDARAGLPFPSARIDAHAALRSALSRLDAVRGTKTP